MQHAVISFAPWSDNEGAFAILQGLSEILQHLFYVSLLPLWQLLIPWFWIYRLRPEPMFNENFLKTMLFKLSKPVAPSLLLFATAVLVSCSGHNHSDGHSAEAEEHEHKHDHTGEIVMSPSDALRFGVKSEAIEKAPFAEVVKTVGEILPASSDRAVVSAPTSGIVRLSRGVELGKSVRSGEVIASVSAKNVSGGDINEAAKANFQAAKRELDRLEPLLKEGIVTKKDYNEALRAYEEAKSAFSPVAAGGSAVAGIPGVISELPVNDGAYVEAGQTIAVIGRNSRLTLRALLPAAEAAFLPKVATANFRPSRGGEMVSLADRNCTILSSSPTGTTLPGYVAVYFSFDSNGDVVPGMPAEVYLIGTDKAEALAVPVGAVSEQQGENFIYVKVDDHAYKKQPVTLGRSDGRRIEVLSGVNEGDSVVTYGSTFVRLAETSTVVPEGHSHSH